MWTWRGEVDAAFRAAARSPPENLVARKPPSFGRMVRRGEGHFAEHGCPEMPEAPKDHAALVCGKALAAAVQGGRFAARVDPARAAARPTPAPERRAGRPSARGAGS